MSRTKKQSSTVARIRDLFSHFANNFTGELDALQSETEELYEDSARLKEIEPALNRLQAALKPASTPPITEPPTTEPPIEPPTEPPAEVVKKAKRIRKKLAETPEEPPSNLNVG